MRGHIEINPYKEYNWIDLPRDVIITDVKPNISKERLEIHYKSKSGQIHCSNGEFGFEYYSFKENEDIEIVCSMPCELRNIVYSKLVDYNGENILIIVLQWKKR